MLPVSQSRSPATAHPSRRSFLLIVLAAISSMLLILPAVPAAADSMTITGSGSQQSGRWQVFPLDSSLPSQLKVTATWSGGGDVNVFLKTANNTTVAYDNAVDSRGPVTVRHDGQPTVKKVAVLVKSGSANWTVSIEGADGTGPPSSPPSAGSYPGEPPVGKIYFGASQQGNQDPWSRLERPTGERLGVRRTFYRWNQRSGYMIRTASEDVAAGRLPWVSVKPPSWRAMARGDHDGQIDQMLRALDDVAGPVWLTVAHEPEGGGSAGPDDPGGPDAFVGMNRRVRQRMDALGVDNVALVPIFMTWTWDPRSGRDPNEWYASGIFDLLGTDLYDRRGTGLPLPSRSWQTQRRWAADRGLDMAVGEWGIVGNDSAAANQVRRWHEAVVDTATDGGGARVVAMSVYDNDLNDWRMRGPKLETVRELVAHPDNVNP